MPFAIVEGKTITELPQDLYIPPDALEVFLDAFEGPLDLLLYLIRRQNLDILNIPVAAITEQYMAYIELMKELRFELAAEYLVMAAVLAEIKSRSLLPRPQTDEEEEGDPRADLIRRLQEYERYKQAAEAIDEMPRQERDFWTGTIDLAEHERPRPLPDVTLQELLLSLSRVLVRADRLTRHRVRLDPLSTRERMSQILSRLSEVGDTFVPFVDLFDPQEGRPGVVVTFISIMELIREQLLELVQNEPFAPIHVRSRGHLLDDGNDQVDAVGELPDDADADIFADGETPEDTD